MKKVITTGKTVEQATELALKKLGVPRDRVTITVLTQPSRGLLFGLFGKRDAEVEVEVLPATEAAPQTETASPGAVSRAADASTQEAPQQNAVSPDTASRKKEAKASAGHAAVAEALQETRQFIEDVVSSMKLDDVTVSVQDDGDLHYTIRLSGESIGLLIGRRGQTLDSLQYLANLVANKNSAKFLKITLDAEDYRNRRKETLEKLADRLAEKALNQRRDVLLEPMSNSERKIIHAHLQGRNSVVTYSQGDEPNRRVVISPKNKPPGSKGPDGHKGRDRRPRRKQHSAAKTPSPTES